jgi:hypothetical protein
MEYLWSPNRLFPGPGRGGVAPRYAGPSVVYAQVPAAPQEIRAQKFVLVDEAGVARGVFGVETNGSPELEVMDSKGHVFACEFVPWDRVHGWSSESWSPGPKKQTSLPIKP